MLTGILNSVCQMGRKTNGYNILNSPFLQDTKFSNKHLLDQEKSKSRNSRNNTAS